MGRREGGRAGGAGGPAGGAAYTGRVAGRERGGARRLPRWLPYTALRTLFFLVPLVLTYGLGGNIYIAAIVAAIVGFCLSLIFLNRQRIELAGDLAARRREAAAPQTDSDEVAEDAALEQGVDRRVQQNAGQAGDQAGSASARPNPTP